MKRRSRAKWFVASFLAGFVAIEAGLTFMLESSLGVSIDYEFQLHLRQMRELRDASPGQPFLLALGSSRLQMALDPEAIEPDPDDTPYLVYNGAIAGFGATQVHYGLCRYLRAGLRPDYLLLEINPGWSGWDPPIHTPLQVERMTIWESLSLVRYTHGLTWTGETLAQQRAIPSHSLRKKILLQTAPQWLPHQTAMKEKPIMYKHGGAKINMSVIPDDRRAIHIAQARKQYETNLANFRISAPSDTALRELLTFCQKEKIPVAILLTPEGPAFRGMYRPGARTEFVAWIEKVASDQQAEVIDTWTWCLEEDFWDSHHMLAKPAVQFTRRLWDERLLPWLRSQRDYSIFALGEP